MFGFGSTTTTATQKAILLQTTPPPPPPAGGNGNKTTDTAIWVVACALLLVIAIFAGGIYRKRKAQTAGRYDLSPAHEAMIQATRPKDDAAVGTAGARPSREDRRNMYALATGDTAAAPSSLETNLDAAVKSYHDTSAGGGIRSVPTRVGATATAFSTASAGATPGLLVAGGNEPATKPVDFDYKLALLANAVATTAQAEPTVLEWTPSYYDNPDSEA